MYTSRIRHIHIYTFSFINLFIAYKGNLLLITAFILKIQDRMDG